MNWDNRRLKEIQQLKGGYEKLMDTSELLSDILFYKNKINELEKEEKEILKRCDAL